MQPAAARAGAALEVTKAPPALTSLDLPAILLVVSVAEVVLHRWGIRLFFPGLFAQLDPSTRWLEVGGRFAFNLTGALAVGITLWLAGVVAARRDLYAGPVRALWAGAGVYLAGITAAALVMRGSPEGLVLHARAALLLFLGGALAGMLPTPGEARHKVGALCFLVPVCCVSYAAFAFRFPGLAPHGDLSGLPTSAMRVGESAVVACGLISFLCFMPIARARHLGGRGPLMLATIAVGAAVLSARRFDLSVRAGIFAVGIDLPLQLGLRAVYLTALFSLGLTVLSLIAEGGPGRTVGVGLALFAVAGFQGQHPVHLALAAVGFASLVLGGAGAYGFAPEGAAISATGRTPVDERPWRLCVGAIRAALSPPFSPLAEAVIVDDDAGRITRVRGNRGGQPVTVRARLVGGLVSEIELSVGAAVSGRPVLSMHAHTGGSLRLGPAARARVLRTGDATFDAHVRLRGPAAALDFFGPEFGAHCAAWGYVGVWPDGRAVLRARHPDALEALLPSAAVAAGDPAAAERLLAALDLLLGLVSRLGPPPR